MKRVFSAILLSVCAAMPCLAQRSTPIQLLHPSGAANDQFGSAVAVDGDTMIVGAPTDGVGANTDQGSAHVYRWTGSGWMLEATLAATGGAAGDNFGISVAISGDTAIIGAYQEDAGANTDQGSAYVFTRSGTAWTQQAQLTATGGAANDFFGISVAISGDTAFVGALFDDVGANADQGSASVFVRSPGGTIIGPDFQALATGGAANDLFGSSVALSGDTAIIGAYADDVGANVNQGSAYVFTRSGTTWTQQARLIATDGTTGDFFGWSVALSGDTAIIGANQDDVGANVNQGSAYIFTRSGTNWTQQAQLTATGGAVDDNFGVSVALSGDTAIVGAYVDDVGANNNQGSAYVFTRSGTAWTQQAQLTATGGAASDFFGISVALSGDTAIIGAYQDDVGANADQGSASVFVRSPGGTTWTQQAQLTAAGGAVDDYFGFSVALSGDTAIVGARLDDVGANANQGSASVFTRSGTTWTQQAQLTAAGGAASDFFGFSVALSGDTAIVGAYGNDVGANPDQGSASVFTRSGTTWTQQAKLTATGGAAFEEFGSSVAISGDAAIVGTYLDDVGASSNQGSAWFFDVAANDFSVARNEVTDVTYSTLAAALMPAQSGQQITATEAAWRTIGSINTFGRSLGLFSDGNLRTPSTSVLDLGGSSALAAAPGASVNIFGQFRASGFVDITADAFLLGSRGTMTARTGSSLTINAPVATLEGQTRIETGAFLTLLGASFNIGPVTASLDSTITAGDTITNQDSFSLTSAVVNAPLFFNRATVNIFGSSAVFGSYTNNNGAITTIRSGTLFVFGSLSNDGTIIGTICSNCLGGPPSLDVGGDLNLGSAANLNMPFDGALVRVGGSVDCAINSNTRYDMSLAALQFEGAGTEQQLEAMSKDIGPDALGLDRSRAGQYPIGTLEIGPSPSTVRLVDIRDNDTLGQGNCEAIYVNTIRINAGSRLINTGCAKIYYNTLINNGMIDVPANAIRIASVCAADFNTDGFLTFEDFDAFVSVFEAGGVSADFNADGFLTFEDFDAFVSAFEAGC